MMQTARHFQLKATDTSKLVMELRRKFADMSNDNADKPRKKLCRASSANSDSNNEDDIKKEIENLG